LPARYDGGGYAMSKPARILRLQFAYRSATT
jgi:hypothetical protein